VRASLVLATLLISIAGCNPHGETRRAAHVRVAVGGQTQLIYLPLTLAEKLGYYREQGLDVHIDDFAGGSRALQSLLGGSADVVCGYFDHTVQMAADGRELKAFVAILRYPGLIAVRAPRPRLRIVSLADLKGAMVGVTAPGSATHFFLNYLLMRNGLRAEDVSVTSIGASSASAIAAIERNQVDAGIVVEPTFTQLQDRIPDIHVLADTRTAGGVKATFGVDEYPAAVLYAPESWLTAHHTEARRLAAAIVRTLDWIQSHAPEQIAALVPEFVGTDSDAYERAVVNMLAAYSRDGRLNEAGAKAVHDVLALSLEKVRTADIDLRQTFTNDYLPR
jgi:NitT/TauT family transport system substrate-binding protein